jgi:hypothetical protein
MDLFQYATNLVKSINFEAKEKLKNPIPYLLDEDHHGGAIVLDRGELRSKGTIHARARVEKSEHGEDYGTWEYHYSPDGCQRTVDWMLENDPSYFMNHIAGCRNRGRGQVLRMDNLQDYANETLFSEK